MTHRRPTPARGDPSTSPPWHRGPVEVRLLRPDDDALVTEWHGVMHAVEQDLWPGLAGYSLRDIQAFVRHRGQYRRYDLLAAGEPGGPILGVRLRWRCRCATTSTAWRSWWGSTRPTGAAESGRRSSRRWAGSRRPTGAGSSTRSSRCLWTGPRTTPRSIFAPRVGFEAMLPGNVRHLAVPVEPARLEELRAVVAQARDAGDYRTFTFEAPWPDEYLEDECELLRRMSTDEPSGDADKEEEVWTRDRLREHDELRAVRGAAKLVAVAQHVPSGRLVAVSELLLVDDAPRQAWQLDHHRRTPSTAATASASRSSSPTSTSWPNVRRPCARFARATRRRTRR